MKKRVLCMLLALMAAASICSTASATALDDSLVALAAKVFDESAAKETWMLKSLAAYESGLVCEDICYDESGNRIEDAELIATLRSMRCIFERTQIMAFRNCISVLKGMRE